MTVMNDHTLDFWADVFSRLNCQYGLTETNELTFEQFIENPEANERWIHIYFANANLFTNRKCGGYILLSVFLEHPETLMKAVLCEPQQTESLNPLPLLPAQRKLAHIREWIDRFMGEEQQDKLLVPGAETIAMHDGRFVQPMKHFEPTAKYKSRGAHL